MKKRCRWLLSFSSGELAQRPAAGDPFAGTSVDANALGALRPALLSPDGFLVSPLITVAMVMVGCLQSRRQGDSPIFWVPSRSSCASISAGRKTAPLAWC